MVALGLIRIGHREGAHGVVELVLATHVARDRPLFPAFGVGAGVFFVLGLITFLRMIFRQWSTEIGVTSHRFVERYGLLSMRTNEIALPNIEGVRVNQSILGRIFGYGTVKIEGTGVDSVTTPAIADPVGFVRAIQTAREHTMARFAAGKSA